MYVFMWEAGIHTDKISRADPLLLTTPDHHDHNLLHTMLSMNEFLLFSADLTM